MACTLSYHLWMYSTTTFLQKMRIPHPKIVCKKYEPTKFTQHGHRI